MNIFRSKRSAEPTMSDITNDNEGPTSIFGGKTKAASNGQRRALGDITNAVHGADTAGSQGLASKASRYFLSDIYFPNPILSWISSRLFISLIHIAHAKPTLLSFSMLSF